MSMRPEVLSGILQEVYRAAIEPEIWPVALRQISNALGSEISGVLVQDRRSGRIPLVALDPRSPADALDEYIRYYGAIDDLRRFAVTRPVGEVISDEIPSFAALVRRSECYNDFYARWQMPHFVGGCIASDGQYEGTLVVYRGGRGRRFHNEHRTTMALLLPHVENAVRIWRRLGEASASHEVLSTALDSLSPGIVLLDSAARVVWMNRRARELTASGDGIAVAAGQLRIASQSAVNALQSLMKCADRRLAESRPVHVAVARSGDLPPLSLLAAPIRNHNRELPVDASIMLIITDRAQTSRYLPDHLTHVYGLTATEAALAAALASGTTLAEYAAERGVSIETVRTQMKHVLDKTNTHRQVELVNLILMSPAAVLLS